MPSISSIPGDLLTHAQRQSVYKNLAGYDITDLMVKLSKVNLFLHGFPGPAIHIYDTLSNDARWHEKADLILANPPFMTPKGGVTPQYRSPSANHHQPASERSRLAVPLRRKRSPRKHSVRTPRHAQRERFERQAIDAVAVDTASKEAIEDNIRRLLFEKPDEFWNLPKLQNLFKTDRLPTLREIRARVFGFATGVSTRSQLANEEFERFLTTQEINPTHLRKMRTVFTAFLLDADCRTMLVEGRFAELRAHDASLYGSLSLLSTQERDTLLGYLQSEVSLKQFELAARVAAALFCSIRPLLEFQCGGIHAVPQAGRLGTVFKDVAQVRVATAANDFGASCKPSAIGDLAYVVGGDRLEEARPAGAGLEFRVGIKQLLAAADTAIHARLVVVPIRAGEGSFGPFFSSNLELLRRQPLLPFVVIFRNRLQIWIGLVRGIHGGSLSKRRNGLVARRPAGDCSHHQNRTDDDSREHDNTLEHGSILRVSRESTNARFKATR